MKRRTTWISFISATLVVAGYVAWCGRSFYLDARIPDAGKLPPEVNAMLPPLLEDTEIARPEAFVPLEMIRYLCLPHESRGAAEIRIREISPDLLSLVRHSRSIYMELHFRRENGKWRPLEEEELLSN